MSVLAWAMTALLPTMCYLLVSWMAQLTLLL